MSNPQQRDNPTNVIEHFTTEAWRLYHAGQTERAFDLAREMLANPRLSDYHEARMHMLLSTAKSDSAVSHDEKAVELLDHLYDNINPPATAREEAARQTFLVNARQLLPEARRREAEVLAASQAKYAGMTPDEICEAQVAEMVARYEAEGGDDASE